MQPSDRILAKVLIRMVAIMAVFATSNDTAKGAELVKVVEDLAFNGNSTPEMQAALTTLRKEVLDEMRAEQAGLASPVPYPTDTPQPYVREPRTGSGSLD